MQVTNSKSRNIYFDILKGIAIILVAYGHVCKHSTLIGNSRLLGKLYMHFICHYLCL